MIVVVVASDLSLFVKKNNTEMLLERMTETGTTPGRLLTQSATDLFVHLSGRFYPFLPVAMGLNPVSILEQWNPALRVLR